MKNKTSLIILICLAMGAILPAQSSQPWSAGSAYILPKGRFETGLFRPLRYGQSENWEWAVRPITGFLMPNFQVKINRFASEARVSAMRFTVVVPTYLMRALQRDGTGGVLANEPSIPPYPLLVTIVSEYLHTFQLAENRFLTTKYGIGVALGNEAPDPRLLIELPSAFPRTLLHHEGLQFVIGSDLESQLAGKWYYWIDVDIFITPTSDYTFAVEHKLLITRRGSDRRQFSIGYKLTGNQFPFGLMWNIIPIIDFQFAFGNK